eukprot:5516161-Lingulodinium_polyedra.AAC.1
MAVGIRDAPARECLVGEPAQASAGDAGVGLEHRVCAGRVVQDEVQAWITGFGLCARREGHFLEWETQ